MDEILGRENYSIKRRVENMISHPDFYTLEDIKEAYELIKTDNRLSLNTKNKLCSGLKIIKRHITK